jgi:hypothetical protein
MMGLTLPWEDKPSGRKAIEDLFGRVDQALALLEAGLPL